MAKRIGRKAVDRARFREFQRVAEHFYEAARDSLELEYWTAAGVLIVHVAIAYADALSIRLSGQRSAGENHEDAIAVLEEAAAEGEEKQKAMNQFRRIIEEKTMVSYSGDLYTEPQIRELWKRLQRFKGWTFGEEASEGACAVRFAAVRRAKLV